MGPPHSAPRRCTMVGMTLQLDESVWTTGDRLRKTRTLAGMSTGEIAEALGVSRNTITRWEHDKVTPRQRDLIAWGAITGAGVTWLRGPYQAGMSQRPRLRLVAA